MRIWRVFSRRKLGFTDAERTRVSKLIDAEQENNKPKLPSSQELQRILHQMSRPRVQDKPGGPWRPMTEDELAEMKEEPNSYCFEPEVHDEWQREDRRAACDRDRKARKVDPSLMKLP